MGKKRREPSIGDAIFGKPPRWAKNPLGLPTQKKKDIRRAFTKTQQNEILYQQDGKCARCHEKLDPRATEFDHKKPWASGGRTIKRNGRALCANCHKKISHEARLKRVDKKRKPRNINPLF